MHAPVVPGSKPDAKHRAGVRARAASAAADGPGDERVAAPEVKGNSSFSQAVVNILNLMLGVGLLSIPFALSQSGWIGLCVLWFFTFITNYTGKALVDCHTVVQQRQGGKRIGYEDIAEAAFGSIGRKLVSAIMYTELFGTCCLLSIFQGDNFFKLLGDSFASSPKGYMLLGALAIIPTMWLPDLKALSALGVVGVCCICTVAISVVATLLTGNYVAGTETTLASWQTLPLVFGILVFVHSGHGVFPSVRASMKDPDRFPQVLNTAFIIVALLCTTIGACGYYMYGGGVADIVVFNMSGALASLVSVALLLVPVAKFPITLEPVAAAALKLITGGGVVPAPVRLIVRTLLAMLVVVSACTLPFLASLMSFLGACLTVSISVILPPACQLVLRRGQLSTPHVAWNAAVMALGGVCMVTGTMAAARNLAAKAAASAAGAPVL